MSKYYGYIVLYVNEFDADGVADAGKKLDAYADVLAKAGGGLSWEEVDYKVMESSSNDVVIPFYREGY